MKIYFCLLVVLLTACGGGGGSGQSENIIQPKPIPVREESLIISTVPNDSELLVKVDSPLKIVFDGDIDLSALNNAFSIDGTIKGTWAIDSNTHTATFTHQDNFAYLETYTVTMVATSKSENGNVLGADYSWTFTTQNEATIHEPINNQVAILDLSGKNNASNTSTKGLVQTMDIMGMPYILTVNTEQAIHYPIIYTSSYIASGTLTDHEQQLLKTYVETGGVLVSASLSNSNLYDLFGITDQHRINTRNLMNWHTDTQDPVLTYFDDPKEKVVSLGGGSNPIYIYTRSYNLDSATALASFNDDSIAISKNSYGSGVSYLLGVSYSDVIIRNQMNLDYNAERSFMNDFEPTTDTFMLFLRAIYEENIPFATWKHTSPGVSLASLIVTHDVDSQSSADWMESFVDMESKHGVSASYNINTHYIDDFNDDDYYSMNIAIYQYALEKGHVISSHSVGHFRDWDDEVLIPLGNQGNTKDNYQPYHDGVSTSGASAYGELEVSKNLLENDLGNTVKTFRSGHLLWNDNQVVAMENLGYHYDTSFSANSALTNFPYRLLYNRKFSSDLSPIYEFPLVISDGPSAYEHQDGAVSVWLDVLNKNINNNSLTVLLIHPNREFKLNDLDSFLEQMPSGVTTKNMDEFGDYWTARDKFDYVPVIENNKLTLTLDDSYLQPINESISIIIKDGTRLNNIDVVLPDGSLLSYKMSYFDDQDIILHSFHLD